MQNFNPIFLHNRMIGSIQIANSNDGILALTTNLQSSAPTILIEKLRNASKRYQNGDWNGAIRFYNEAIKLDQSNHILYGNRSILFTRIGKFEKALQDAIKARELCPDWSKAFYLQGVALQFLRRHQDALAAFASGLAQEPKSLKLLSCLIETAMKSPLRATLEPVYRQLQVMNFDKSPFVICSVIGQELLAANQYAAAVVVLESALIIGSCSLKLCGSVLSALSTAYWALNNLDKAIDYMEQDLDVAKSLGDILGECRAYSNLGSAFFAKCSYKEALQSHRYQLVLAMKHKHREQAALALTSLGHVYSAIGDLKNALSSHQQCLQIVRQLGDSLAEAREIGNVGTVHLASGSFQKAIECHLEHVKLAKLLGSKTEEARAYSNLGSAYHSRRQYEKAIQFQEQVLRISQEIGDRIIESKAYAGLGHAARCMKDYIQAKRWYERQLDAALSTKNRSAEAKACSNLGLIYQLLGDFDGALKLHWSHLNICKHLNDQKGTANAYANIAKAYSGMKLYEDALKYYKIELQIAKDVQDRITEAIAHGDLAQTYQSLNLYDEAIIHLNLHLSLAKDIKDLSSEAQALCNLGDFYSKRKNFEKALDYYNLYLRLSRCLENREKEAHACNLLGMSNYHLENYEQAMRLFEMDLELSKELEDQESISRAYCHLGLVYKALGNLDQSLEHYRKYLCLLQDDLPQRLKAMGLVAECLQQQSKIIEAVKILEKKQSLAKSINDVSQEASALKSLGECYRIAGDYEKAASYFKQSICCSASLKDFRTEIRTLDHLGECYLKSKNYEQALECYQEQLDKCEQLSQKIDSEEITIEEYDSNDGYYGRRRKMIDTFEEYLEICVSMGNAFKNVGNTKFQMSLFEEAAQSFTKEMELFRDALERSEKMKKIFLSSNVLGVNFGDDFKQKLSQTFPIENEINNNENSNEIKLSTKIISLLDSLTQKEIDSIRSIGDCYFAVRRYDEAIKFYQDFLSRSKSLVDQEQVYCLLGKCYQLNNNLNQALVWFEKRLFIAHELGCDQTKAMAYEELGHLHRLLRNYEQAITCFEHEQKLGKKHSLKNKMIETSDECSRTVEQNFGLKSIDQNRTKMIDIGLLIEAEALHGLGCVAQEIHDYERSLKYHSFALNIAREIESLELESRAYGAIGSAYNALGNYESAVRYQEKHLSVAQIIGDLNAQIAALSALGKIYSSTSQFAEAAKYFGEALIIVQRDNQNIGYRDEEEARILYELGMALWALNDLELAEIHLRRSVDLIENLQNLNSSISKLMIAPISSCNLMFNTNNYSSGSSTGGSDASSSSSSHYGPLKWQNIISTPSMKTTQPHHHYLHYQGASYEALIKILISLDRPTEALLIAERSRTRSFAKTRKGFRVFSISTIDQIIEMSKSQNAGILYYSMTIDGSYNSWLITPNEVHFASLIKSDREKIFRLIKNIQTSLFQGSSSSSKSFDSTQDDIDFDNVSLDRTLSMNHLKRNHLLNSSSYSLSSLFSLASTITTTSATSNSKGRLRPIHYESRKINSNDSIENDRQSSSNEREGKRFANQNWEGFTASTELYEILIGPFQAQLIEDNSLNQLLLVLDGDLFLVPWNMLRNRNGEFLSEKYSLLVIPSLHVLRGDQSTKTLRKQSCDDQKTITSLVIANPTMPNKLDRVQNANTNCPPKQQLRQPYFENLAASKEASLVSELLSTRPLIGTEANKEAVLAQLTNAQCIHFSSYIIDNTDGDPLKMATGLGIAISPSDVLIGDSAHQLHDHEYLLTPHDLISIGLSAKLVVISCPAISSRANNQASEVNSSAIYSSSQVLKIVTSALLQAGAACVLLTLWPVPLSALQVLFRIFYCSLLQGTHVSTALKEAVLTIQNTSHFSHPRNWAGFILIGSDVRLSSQVALMSSSLALLLKTPDRSRDAMRVVLHLVEKSLQRIQRGQKNAMYTTVQSIENKIGPNTQGWKELLISVGFRFEPASANGLPACVFFPQSDLNNRLLGCSMALQAILVLSPATISAISKLIANSEYVSEIIEKLGKMIEHDRHEKGGDDEHHHSVQMLSSYLETIHIKLWSQPGCHELYASLGFDLMEIGTDSVTLRAGKNANIRTIMFAQQTLQSLFDNNDNLERKNDRSKSLIPTPTSSTISKHKIETVSPIKKPPRKNLESIDQFFKESPNARSRNAIGRNPLDAELIEMKLNAMTIPTLLATTTTASSSNQMIDSFQNLSISGDLQSITTTMTASSHSSLTTTTTNTTIRLQPIVGN
ncbi:Rapsynoid-like protein [Sarcoptes scabiei]|uniref:Rapsynoid-like protein n=1 Tax=Sarcoptes scabiei TaxID=52283 RepID=A0A132ADH8_SARSC|nr:Rapsynoid-like protein [Sarcoptes scabiei]